MPNEPRESPTEFDKKIHFMIRVACIDVFREIDDLPEFRSIPPSRSDLWVSMYRQDLCAIIRDRMRSIHNVVPIVLDREIIRVWLALRKNPEAAGIAKRSAEVKIDIPFPGERTANNGHKDAGGPDFGGEFIRGMTGYPDNDYEM